MLSFVMPALFISTSTEVYSFSIDENASSTDSDLEISIWIVLELPPLLIIFSETSSALSFETEKPTTT